MLRVAGWVAHWVADRVAGRVAIIKVKFGLDRWCQLLHLDLKNSPIVVELVIIIIEDFDADDLNLVAYYLISFSMINRQAITDYFIIDFVIFIMDLVPGYKCQYR